MKTTDVEKKVDNVASYETEKDLNIEKIFEIILFCTNTKLNLQ